MSFQSPLALIGLVLVPVLVGLYILRERRRESYATRFTAASLLPNLVAAAPGWRRHLPVALFLVALAAMIVGVARPHASVSVQREEATVLIAIDSSLSMSAQDVRPSRLVAAQSAAQAFVDGMPKKFRVGVIGFAGRAYVAVPPTEDRELVHSALEALKPGEGTALGDAVALGTRLARAERTSDGRIPPTAMLVISDGAQMSGRTTPEVAATQARSAHIPVYTVVVGTPDGVVNVPVAGGYHAQLRVPPSPETLRTVARITAGQFSTAPDATRLRQIYEKLGSRLGHRREKREITDRRNGCFLGGRDERVSWTARVRPCRRPLGRCACSADHAATTRRFPALLSSRLRGRRVGCGADRPCDRHRLPRQARQSRQPWRDDGTFGLVPGHVHRERAKRAELPPASRMPAVVGRRVGAGAAESACGLLAG